MNMNSKLALALLVGGLLMTVGCGDDDANKPKTLKQQQDLMNGHYKPTKQQLDSAMNSVQIPTPGPNEGSRMPPANAGSVPKTN